MVTLEEILQKHFGCKTPFKKNERLSKEGWKAYGKLVSLIYDLGTLVEGFDANDMVETLDNITEEIG